MEGYWILHSAGADTRLGTLIRSTQDTDDNPKIKMIVSRLCWQTRTGPRRAMLQFHVNQD